MKVKLTSWTLWFNLSLIGAGFAGPFLDLDKETKNLLISNGLIGLGLRAKTRESLIRRK